MRIILVSLIIGLSLSANANIFQSLNNTFHDLSDTKVIRLHLKSSISEITKKEVNVGGYTFLERTIVLDDDSCFIINVSTFEGRQTTLVTNNAFFDYGSRECKMAIPPKCHVKGNMKDGYEFTDQEGNVLVLAHGDIGYKPAFTSRYRYFSKKGFCDRGKKFNCKVIERTFGRDKKYLISVGSAELGPLYYTKDEAENIFRNDKFLGEICASSDTD